MAINFQQTNTGANASAEAAHCSGATENTDEDSYLCTDGGSAGNTSTTTTVDASAADYACIYFECTVAADVTWAAGTWTINLNVTTGNHQLTLDAIYICRLNSSYTNQATIGSSTGIGQNLATAQVYSPTVTGAAQTPSAGDLVVVILMLDNAQSMTNDLVWTNDQVIASPFTGAGGGIPVFMHHYKMLRTNG